MVSTIGLTGVRITGDLAMSIEPRTEPLGDMKEKYKMVQGSRFRVVNGSRFFA